MADSRQARTPHAAIVIPFYNEERRFDRVRLVELAGDPAVELIVVDDGSKDRTAELLSELEATSDGKVHFLKLDTNRGKGEAVRLGLLRALERGHDTVGFTDADFSTRPGELLGLLSTLETRDDLDVIVASRVHLDVPRVEPREMRH